MAFFGVNFIFQKFCQCKKNDKYEVCVKQPPFSFSCDAYNCTIVHRLHPPIISKHEDSAAIMEMGSTMRSSPKILIYKLKIYFLDLIWLGYMLCQRKCIFWGFYWIPSMECSNTWMTFSFPQFPISILIINKFYAYLSYFNPINW